MNTPNLFRALTIFLGTVIFALSATAAKADQVFVVNSNTPDGAVSATATFHQSGSNLLQITLNNTGITTDVGQGISGITFQILSGGSLLNVTATITTQQNPEINVGNGGVVTHLGTLTSGWGLGSAGPTINLTALGFTGQGTQPPDELILGTLSNPNGSIAGNGPHNPFIDHVGTFTLTLSQTLPSNFQIANVIFQFGTGPTNVPGTPVPVPEPTTMVLLGTGLLGLASFARRFRR